MMQRTSSIIKKFLLALYLILIHLLVAFLVYERWLNPYFTQPEIQAEDIKSPTEVTAIPTLQPIPSIASPTPFETETNANQTQSTVPTNSTNALRITVVGVKREQ